MKPVICNPLNVNYRYQYTKSPVEEAITVNREAADPSLIYFKGKYYLVASMTLDVWVSDDLVAWQSERLPAELPLYGYAPDIRVVGDYVYFCANESTEVCHFYRSKDLIHGPYEKIAGSFAFLDPNLFADDDGRLYFYWGLSCKDPIYGVELDPQTMQPLGEKRALIEANPFEKGFERIGDDNRLLPVTAAELEVRYQAEIKKMGLTDDAALPIEMQTLIKDILREAPYLEGAWMNKFGGKYYLQYAAPGTHFNVYGDSVYVSDQPLGPFTLAENNPYSYQPGGFLTGSGHGSTMEDPHGNLWHAATSRISLNHQFERRVGIWPAGIDVEGELFCNQRYGDWPLNLAAIQANPWAQPEWYLLSYGKSIQASSEESDHPASLAINEDIRTWWRATTNEPGEWLTLDLGEAYPVAAIQINFADDRLLVPAAAEKIVLAENRYIVEETQPTRWLLEGSLDGSDYFVMADKTKATTDLAHDLIVNETAVTARYIKLTIMALPYQQQPAVSGLRVFGCGTGLKPEMPQFQAVRTSDLDMEVTIQPSEAVGYNILWGHQADKLYHSYLVYHEKQRIGALVKDREYYVRVDAFNESGITEGKVVQLSKV